MAEFKKQFLGYDVEQVDQVIGELDAMVDGQGAQITQMQRQIDEQGCELRVLRRKISDYEEKETAIAKVMVNAEKIAMKMVRSAENESKDILGRAQEHQQAKLKETQQLIQGMVNSNDSKLAGIRTEYKTWITRQEEATMHLRSLLESQVNVLKNERNFIDQFELSHIS